MYISITSANDNLNLKISKKLGQGHSHLAEELALYSCVELLKTLSIDKNITLYSDQVNLVNLIKCEKPAEKSIKKFNHILEIRDFFSKHPNISLEWVKSSKNLAHSLITLAYKGTFFNNLPTKQLCSENSDKTNLNTSTNDDESLVILNLKNELLKKDLIIKDLMKLINKLNKSIA